MVHGFVTGAVTVAVPATSANLGPGFDCLGLALDLHDELTGEVTEAGLSIEIEGEGEHTLPRDQRHLVVRSMRTAFVALGLEPPGLRLRFRNRIPHARGLGSSSAAIVGGLALARALAGPDGPGLDDASMLRLANELEGHPDNVAPALRGGFVISGQAGGEVWAVRSPITPEIHPVVFVPPDPVSTELARGLLPAQVDHAAAAADAGRAALLVAALAGADADLVRATEDFLHQDFRAPAMPASHALVQRLRALGLAAVISGAGPTVMVLATGDVDEVLAHCPDGWWAHAGAVDHAGVRIVAPSS